MKDNLYPSRIIIGDEINSCKNIASIFTKIALNEPNVMYMSSSEAEAVKLFANTYLAMRVAFFNELDTFSLIKTLDVKKIINGICADQRIGNYYNNPSLVMVAIVYLKTQNNFYLVIKMYLKILFKQLLNQIKQERNSL